jgi:hypothetical protein
VRRDPRSTATCPVATRARAPGAIGGVLLAAAVLAGCGAVSHDNPAFTGAPAGGVTVTTTATSGAAGPAISQVVVGSVRVPHVAGGGGAAAINAALDALAGGLGVGGRSCSVTTARSDATVVSFRWTCSDRSVATATFGVATGRRLVLGDVLTGAYLPYLASTSDAQLAAGGASPAVVASVAPSTAAAFSHWDVTPSALEVTFPLPSGPATIQFPIASLTAYLTPGGPLR